MPVAHKFLHELVNRWGIKEIVHDDDHISVQLGFTTAFYTLSIRMTEVV